VQFLQSWGWRTQRGKDGKAKVFILWYDAAGVQRHAPAYHLRHYLDKDDEFGPRFTWDLPKGVKLPSYGCWRISEWLDGARSQGIAPHLWITESEIDALTFWHHGIPAVSIGGATNWRSDWSSRFFNEFKKVYIAQEPGPAGMTMVKSIGDDLLQRESLELVAVPFPDAIKDANALHQLVRGDTAEFRKRLDILMQQGRRVADIIQELKNAETE
jgi:Toprim-like